MFEDVTLVGVIFDFVNKNEILFCINYNYG